MLSFFQPNPSIKKQKTDADLPQVSLETTKALLTETDSSDSTEKVFLANLLEGVDNGWSVALAQEIAKPYFRKLNDFVAKELKIHQVYPPTENIFTAFKLCSIDDVKGWSIIGQ